MSEVTKILASIDENPKAADELLPLVYQELRKFAAAKPKRTGWTRSACSMLLIAT